MKKKILVLGCTGSIGRQTLDIIRKMDSRFEVCGLSAGSNEEKVAELCSEFNCPGTVFSRDGIEGLEALIKNSGADIAVNGIAGAAGLKPSIFVLESGIDLALANKETVVMAWVLVKETAKKHNANIIPVDSEHSAIFNLTEKIGIENISELIITASGGPFRTLSDDELEKVSVEDALKHPTWSMGQKITIDSATLANKGLEVIEACRLFDFPPEHVSVVVHPQSLIHSLVRTKDGILYAQISNPDMRHPIFGALAWPENSQNYLEKFDLSACGEMTFSPPRFSSFPLLKTAFDCAKKGASYTIAFNAANEAAVQAFLDKKCGFMDISRIVISTLSLDWSFQAASIDEILEADRKARLEAERQLSMLPGGIH
ncbi:1-deoxy-D-xylulose-5-phosphate reductoisomerase [Treponema sp.]|uniref:1-deoxy-D-xylulose-5-phosphate reductoisomerase n=1 Tax=Treponema sp. TaxID=166 RepID=UPI003F032A43